MIAEIAALLVAAAIAATIWTSLRRVRPALEASAELQAAGYGAGPPLRDPDGRPCGYELSDTATRVQLACDVPGPLSLGPSPSEMPGLPEPDSWVLHEGDPARVAEVFGPEGYKPALEPTRVRVFVLGQGELRMVWEERASAAQLVYFLELARGLRDELERRRLGWLFDAGWTRQGRTLSGSWEGVPLRLHLYPDGFEVEGEHGLDAVAVHRDHADADYPALGNPVADRLVVGRGLDPVLADGPATEALLAVVHGWPGSRLEPDRVVLSAEEPADLRRAVRDMAALCGALRGLVD